jgi:translation elongation factor EF-Ts
MESLKKVITKKPIKEIIKLISPIQRILATASFKTLNQKEKHYSYYLHNATKIGLLVSFFHRSYESPALFVLLMKIFGGKRISKMRQDLLDRGWKKIEIDKIFYYFGGIV